MKLCKVERCGKKHHGKGYCAYHLNRLNISGSIMGPMPKPLEERFWAKVEKTDGCWNWTACKGRTGYGQFNISKGIKQYAHRYSYELHNGTISDGMQIDHLCHNVSCVRPDHLRSVTAKQNQENRYGASKGSKSGVRGVYWHKRTQKWMARVSHNRVTHYVGIFEDLAEAEEAVRAKRISLYTHNERDRQQRDAA